MEHLQIVWSGVGQWWIIDKRTRIKWKRSVSFVVSGEHEWYNKNKPNIFCGHYHGSVITTVCQCPKDTTNYDDFSTDDLTWWFTKGSNGWTVNESEVPYYTCGSPWCILDMDRKGLYRVVKEVGLDYLTLPQSKSYRYFKKVIVSMWVHLGYQNSRRAG